MRKNLLECYNKRKKGGNNVKKILTIILCFLLLETLFVTSFAEPAEVATEPQQGPKGLEEETLIAAGQTLTEQLIYLETEYALKNITIEQYKQAIQKIQLAQQWERFDITALSTSNNQVVQALIEKNGNSTSVSLENIYNSIRLFTQAIREKKNTNNLDTSITGFRTLLNQQQKERWYIQLKVTSSDAVKYFTYASLEKYQTFPVFSVRDASCSNLPYRIYNTDGPCFIIGDLLYGDQIRFIDLRVEDSNSYYGVPSGKYITTVSDIYTILGNTKNADPTMNGRVMLY